MTHKPIGQVAMLARRDKVEGVYILLPYGAHRKKDDVVMNEHPHPPRPLVHDTFRLQLVYDHRRPRLIQTHRAMLPNYLVCRLLLEKKKTGPRHPVRNRGGHGAGEG